MSERIWITSPRGAAVSALAVAGLASMLLVAASAPSEAAMGSAKGCWKKHAACIARCGRVFDTPARKDACYRRCDAQVVSCVPAEGSSNVETPPDPIHPKGGNPGMPPTGGTRDEPKAPPRVNDTRPPIGGGIFQRSDAGTNGPILRSGGAGQPVPHSGGTSGPIMKSNGGNGPNFRSNGQR
ncbi:hypothetical protein KMZ68_24695 [Bradyrhizobium sediminis]|uniref:Uncharacterized protein n=1 Tax=Bradyrhizobium sediminis TaxID=2840469 RepID=A0A975RS04_9BRAD|nr:hypothetical protein [Bradyrhizobium sediminis]QWG18105.1 hypothetical protein KMZ68_24695 [Bradyrhizobium sediminis]